MGRERREAAVVAGEGEEGGAAAAVERGRGGRLGGLDWTRERGRERGATRETEELPRVKLGNLMG